METTYEELSKKTVAQLRALADELNDNRLQGHSTMHKTHLLPLICEVLGIDTHQHHDVVGINKTRIKQQIRKLKVKRDSILSKKAKGDLKTVRREIHGLKRKIRRATV